MEKFLKILAVVFTLLIVTSIYPAIIWNLFARPVFWILYILCITADYLCIRSLKKLQKVQK